MSLFPATRSGRALLLAGACGAIAAFLGAFLAGGFLAGTVGFEPALAAAAAAIALLVAALAVAAGRALRKPQATAGPAGSRLWASFFAGGVGGALAFALIAESGLLAGPFRSATGAPARAAESLAAGLYGEPAGGTWPDSQTDALLACSQARSLARVLVVGSDGELVRHLRDRGARQIDILDVWERMREQVCPRVHLLTRHSQGLLCDPLAFLREHKGANYDLAVLDLPPPVSIAAGRLYSKEFHDALAGRVGVQGVVVLLVSGTGREEGSVYLGRILATLREVYPQAAVLPDGKGERVRFLASDKVVATLDPAVAARRCSGRLMPGGGAAPEVKPDELKPLLDEKRALALTTGLIGLELAPETIHSPRLFLDYAAEAKAGSSPGALIRAALAAPIWAYFAVPWLALIVGGLIARATCRGGQPGRFALGAAAFSTGLVCAAGVLTAMLVFQADTGNLYGRLGLLAAVALAGSGLGALAAARLAERFRGAARLGLAVVDFGFLLALLVLLGVAGWLTGLAGVLAVGLVIAALGLLGGLELGAIADLAGDGGPAGPGPGSAAVLGGLGAAAGAALVATSLLPALGPPVALLVLLGVKLVELGWLAAGAGRRNS